MRDSKWYGVVCVLTVALLALAGCSEAEAVKVEVLTKEQAVADYDYMWEVLENNFPSLHVPERMYGMDYREIRDTGRDRITAHQSEQITLVHFNDILRSTLSQFRYSYHLNVLAPEGFQGRLDIYNNYQSSHPHFAHYINWEKSTAAYTYLATIPAPYQASQDPVEIIDNSPTFEVIDNSTAMIKIPSFSVYSPEYKDMLLDYYNQAAPYDNLIIDISNNGGGDDWYWRDGIVAPNITEEIIFSHTFLMKSGTENVDYLSLRLPSVAMIPVDESELIEALPNMNQQDLQGMDVVITLTDSIYIRQLKTKPMKAICTL